MLRLQPRQMFCQRFAAAAAHDIAKEKEFHKRELIGFGVWGIGVRIKKGQTFSSSFPPPMHPERAPAKINLYLHVTGKKPDGYHTIDSLTVFARDDEACDRIGMVESDAQHLYVSGPEA